jgi:ribosome-associated toxin RatA of RatAB toxin-antitoxin module
VAPALLPENSSPGGGIYAGVALKVVERSAIVPFTPAQMFDLVNDVASYPQFLPWCSAARVEESGADERIASMHIERGVLRSQFTTRNRLQPPAAILMELIDGPFRALTGQWRFDPIGDRGTRVSFRVEFEFRNPLTAIAFNAAFESMCGTIVDAFAVRAKEIYR